MCITHHNAESIQHLSSVMSHRYMSTVQTNNTDNSCDTSSKRANSPFDPINEIDPVQQQTNQSVKPTEQQQNPQPDVNKHSGEIGGPKGMHQQYRYAYDAPTVHTNVLTYHYNDMI